MDIRLKKLTTDMSEEYLLYFDKVAFTDHEEWAECYCLESHLSREENEALDFKKEKNARRKKAEELVKSGVMQGYLLYDGEKIIGWCNAGDKMDYEPVIAYEGFRTVELTRGLVKILYCIEIAPSYRGKGITHLMVDKVCEDAKTEGYKYVESYPFSDKNFEYQYHGPIYLYEKHGFEIVDKRDWFWIMRKEL